MIDQTRLFSNLVSMHLVNELGITRGNIRLILEAVTYFCTNNKTNIFTIKDILDNVLPPIKRSTVFDYVPNLKKIGVFREKPTQSNTKIYLFHVNSFSMKEIIESDFPEFKDDLRKFIEHVYMGSA
ncbi:hypothetical protein KY358_04225 [Candidatus Woesearchaeota archaeon]|nr:hypothetical protein [Candidatus Woesearchaeota archaeon]